MDLLEILKIIFLGIVEGITEWLPISSTGHMLLVDEFINLDMSEEFKNMFFVVIQLGAIIAVVVMFWQKMFPFQFKEKPIVKTDTINMWIKVVVACIPAGVLGLMFDDFLEENFGTPLTIAIMLIVYGVAFIIIENKNKNKTMKINSLDKITYKEALIIGFFQALAMIPGTSRSGATIVGALLIGVSRVAAAEFTFFLAVPTMLGASVVKLVKFGTDFSQNEIIALVLGMFIAFIVSLAAIKFLMDYVKKHDFKVFGWYRIILGIIVIIYFAIKN